MPKGRANYEKFRTQEYDTICEENNVKQKGKSPTQEDGFVEKAEEMVGPPKSFTQQLTKELCHPRPILGTRSSTRGLHNLWKWVLRDGAHRHTDRHTDMATY